MRPRPLWTTATNNCESRQKDVDALLTGTPSTLELREEENYWQAKQKETADLRTQLLSWANAAQAGLQQLQAQQPVWNATLQQNESTPDLGPTLDVIHKSVSNLQRMTAQVQDQLRVIVNQQIRAANQDQLAIDVLDRLEKERQYLDGRLFRARQLAALGGGTKARDWREQGGLRQVPRTGCWAFRPLPRSPPAVLLRS